MEEIPDLSPSTRAVRNSVFSNAEDDGLDFIDPVLLRMDQDRLQLGNEKDLLESTLGDEYSTESTIAPSQIGLVAPILTLSHRYDSMGSVAATES